MKKQGVDYIALQIKALSKENKNISRDNIRILHEFCQFDYRRTSKVAYMANQMKNPVLLIQKIIKSPQLSQEILGDLQRKYDKTYGPEILQKETQKLQELGEQKIVIKIDYDFFEHIPNDCTMQIMNFLDPYSFSHFAFTSKNHYNIFRSEAQSEYYKNLCTKVFRFITVVFPTKCRFEAIKDYVLAHPNQYGPNTRNVVQSNLRRYIWKMDFSTLTLPSGYYKSFGSYENLFKCCPRLNFNGYYICREKYVRLGQKNEKYPIAPIHVVYYYRYFRFLEDGSVIYHIRSKKMKSQEVLPYLSQELLESQQDVSMIGQYLQDQQKVYIKAVRNQTVFSYYLQIRSSLGKISNELKINKYTLELIDDHQEILQNLYIFKPFHEEKIFEYCFNKDIAQQNSPTVQATSL